MTHESLVEGDEYGKKGELSSAQLRKALLEDAEKQYDQLEADVTELSGDEEQMRGIERGVLLNVVPEVARAPLRNGLPQGGHRPACHGTA